jgi:hypothetical protein
VAVAIFSWRLFHFEAASTAGASTNETIRVTQLAWLKRKRWVEWRRRRSSFVATEYVNTWHEALRDGAVVEETRRHKGL